MNLKTKYRIHEINRKSSQQRKRKHQFYFIITYYVRFICVCAGDAFPVRGILSPEQSRDEAVIDSRAGEEIFVRAKIRRKFNLHISGSLLSDSACSYDERCRIYFRINEIDVYQIWYLPRL